MEKMWKQQKRQAKRSSPIQKNNEDLVTNKEMGFHFAPLMKETEEKMVQPMEITSAFSFRAKSSLKPNVKEKRKRSPAKLASKVSSPSSESPPQTKFIMREEGPESSEKGKQLVLYTKPQGGQAGF